MTPRRGRPGRRGQVAVADYLLAIVIGIAGISGLLALYAVGKGDNPIAAAGNQVTMVEQAVHSFRSSTGTTARYAKLTTPDVVGLAANGGLLPLTWKKGTDLLDPYGLPLAVTGCDAGGCVGVAATVASLRFAVTLPGVPQGDCKDLVSTDFGPDLRVVYVGAGTASSARPMTAAQAGAACQAGTNSITWVFR